MLGQVKLYPLPCFKAYNWHKGNLKVGLPITLQKSNTLPCSYNSAINHLLIRDSYTYENFNQLFLIRDIVFLME